MTYAGATVVQGLPPILHNGLCVVAKVISVKILPSRGAGPQVSDNPMLPNTYRMVEQSISVCSVRVCVSAPQCNARLMTFLVNKWRTAASFRGPCRTPLQILIPHEKGPSGGSGAT